MCNNGYNKKQTYQWKIQSNKNSKTKEYCYSVSSLNTNLHLSGKQELQLKTVSKRLAGGYIHGVFFIAN